jgi:hypothetical protein
MPITLPTPATTPGPGPGPSPSSLSPDSDSDNNILTSLKARIFRPPAFTTTREKSASAVVLLRAASNFVHFVLYGLSRNPLWCLWPILDQLVIAYAVSFVADARGGRRVFGWGVVSFFLSFFFFRFLPFLGGGVCFLLFCGWLLLFLIGIGSGVVSVVGVGVMIG